MTHEPLKVRYVTRVEKPLDEAVHRQFVDFHYRDVVCRQPSV